MSDYVRLLSIIVGIDEAVDINFFAIVTDDTIAIANNTALPKKALTILN